MRLSEEDLMKQKKEAKYLRSTTEREKDKEMNKRKISDFSHQTTNNESERNMKK